MISKTTSLVYELPKRRSHRQQIVSTTTYSNEHNRKKAWRHRKQFNKFHKPNAATIRILPPAKLSNKEAAVLSKGLQFVPDYPVSTNQCHKDLDSFKFKLAKYASPYSYDRPRHPYLPGKQLPQTSEEVSSTINRYIGLTRELIDALSPSKRHRSNLNHQQRQTLNNLTKREDIVIKKSDKGDTIVVETKENYIKDGLDHLSDANIYHRIEEDINPKINDAINKFLKHSLDRGLIDNDIFNFLTVDQPRTPIIYFLKKLHKNPISVHPIVSNINSPTSRLSAFMDILLKPIVNSIKHILKNSTTVIKEMEDMNVPNNSILVSADVSSLYPSIPIKESINVILGFINEYNDPTHPPIYFVENLLNFILNYNCFNFVYLFFLQVRGIAMGTKMAPTMPIYLWLILKRNLSLLTQFNQSITEDI